MKAAAIDIGTNTLKLTVGEVDAAGGVKILADERLGARLGEGVDSSGKLSKEAQRRTFGVLREIVERARETGADSMRIVATSAMRDASNRDDFIELAKRELGVRVEVLSEQDEALFSYRAVALDPVLGCKRGKHLVFDIGGGSTELTVGAGGDVSVGKSLKIGAVRITERYLKNDPPTDSQIAEAREFIEQTIVSAVLDRDVDRLVGVGGTIVNVAAMVHEIPVERYTEVHGLKLTREQVRENTRQTASLPVSERKTIVGLEPDRADVIVGGALVLEGVMHVFGADEFTVSIRGLRYGVLYDMLGLNEPA